VNKSIQDHVASERAEERGPAEPAKAAEALLPTEVQTVTVTPDENDMRVDHFLRGRFPGLSFLDIERIVHKGEVRVDGKRVDRKDRLEIGQSVRIPPVKLETPKTNGTLLSLWRNLQRPLAAALLAVLPFWLFLGSVYEQKVNGEMVSESRLNLLGIGMAAIALGLAFSTLRRDDTPGRPPRWWPRTMLAIAVIPVALFQLGYSIGFYTFKDIEIAVFGRHAPPAATADQDHPTKALRELPEQGRDAAK